MFSLPSSQIMYNALVKKDSNFEGIFFAGIKTTGIFCRPTCPARKPFIENVEFFPSAQAALTAGYRPCARCRPLEKGKKPVLVGMLETALKDSPDQKLTNIDLKQMGIDPSTARRQFLRTYGMTFHAYQRAHQMGQAAHQIRQGERIIMAQISQGYSSASGFWSAFRKVMGETPKRAAEVHTLQAGWIETPLGPMLALADGQGLHLLDFVDRKGLEREIIALRKRTDSVVVPGDNPVLDLVKKELNGYFSGAALQFTVPLIMGGTPFEKLVWSLLRQIPPGETWSYQRMAGKLNKPSASRAMGNANGRNVLALVIPCHRVIRADGSLGGYGGGVWRKQWLLDHERKTMAAFAES
jgi:AraC family transcriptional regulator of adaptative response/methylated-DNA-[protein]-cysteine methyltransferase